MKQEKGHWQDRATQLWVKLTGQRVNPHAHAYLFGPVGNTRVIDYEFIASLCAREQLSAVTNLPQAGLLGKQEGLALPADAQKRLHPRIEHFYTHTASYHFDVWAKWSTGFSPIGHLLSKLFTQRLRQLNLPLDPLDTAEGMQSRLIKLKKRDGSTAYTIWHRSLNRTGQVVYSGFYGRTTLPASAEDCLKVIFPLPNGNATVLLRKTVTDDGSLLLTSKGKRFGDPGFYFFLSNHKGKAWARFVRSVTEQIHVYVDAEGVLRTDHELRFYGKPVFKLHYKMMLIEME